MVLWLQCLLIVEENGKVLRRRLCVGKDAKNSYRRVYARFGESEEINERNENFHVSRRGEGGEKKKKKK